MPPVLQQVSSHRPVVAGQEGFGPGGGSVPVDDPRNQWPNFAPPGGNEAERDPSTSLDQTLGHNRQGGGPGITAGGTSGVATSAAEGAALGMPGLGGNPAPAGGYANIGEAVEGLLGFTSIPGALTTAVETISGIDLNPISIIGDMLGGNGNGNAAPGGGGLGSTASPGGGGLGTPGETGLGSGSGEGGGGPAGVAAAAAAIGEAVAAAAANAGGHQGSGGPGSGAGAGAGAPAGHGPGQGTAGATGTGGVGAGAW